MRAKSLKKLFSVLATATALSLLSTMGSMACTTLFVGGGLTADGNPIVARSEDYVNSASKLAFISPAGQYKAGEKYMGCEEYGAFEWTWTHDSYRFMAFTADVNFNGTCPECGKAGHFSYTESGTNEKGLTVSATESLSGNGKVNGEGVDPLRQTKVNGKVGIEESDIPTVLLSEAATAREALDLLTKIYDEYGCYYASGLFVADQNEIWYIENCSGTQYLAVKLPDSIMFLEPNISVIGLIDLDDTENVVASDRLIEVAKQAGTYVGSEEENTINFRDSYARLAASSRDRLSKGLNFVNGSYNYVENNLLSNSELFTISNVKDGKVVAPYTNITPDRKFTPDDVVNYYKIDGIANTGNTDTAFFQIDSSKSLELGTVEWTSMSHGAYNVFIPTYPMLMDSLYAGYGASVGEARKNVADKPSAGLYYRAPNREGLLEGYTVLPEDWEKSFYWTFDGLSNYILYAGNDGPAVSQEAVEYVVAQFAVLQQEIYSEFEKLNATLPATANSAARTAVNEYHARMSEKAHKLALELVDYVRADVAAQTAEKPVTPVQPSTATPTNDKLSVNDTPADPTVFKIGGSNYFKIRDVAALLNGTEKQFSVGYDGALNSVTATTGEGYEKLDTDLAGAASAGDRTAEPSNDAIYVNGEKVEAEVYKIEGSNYFKLRDLGKALDFYVGWTAERGMYIETAKPYAE